MYCNNSQPALYISELRPSVAQVYLKGHTSQQCACRAQRRKVCNTKPNKSVSYAVSSLIHVYLHQALVDESPHTPGYSRGNVVNYLRVPNCHAHGHNHATVSNIPDGYVCQSCVFFYRGFSRLRTRARPPVLSEAEMADTDHPYDTLRVSIHETLGGLCA